jgi:hypothetical protein
MTSWTKVTDESSSYTKETDQSTSYTPVADQSSVWGMTGGLIYLATEGSRDLIMSEGELDYLVYSKGVDGITWTDVSDQSTAWNKVIDA